jgi:hypothetical protein
VRLATGYSFRFLLQHRAFLMSGIGIILPEYKYEVLITKSGRFDFNSSVGGRRMVHAGSGTFPGGRGKGSSIAILDILIIIAPPIHTINSFQRVSDCSSLH